MKTTEERITIIVIAALLGAAVIGLGCLIAAAWTQDVRWAQTGGVLLGAAGVGTYIFAAAMYR